MPTARGVGARRALVLIGVALVLLLMVADLLRRDSLILGLLTGEDEAKTRPEVLIEDIRGGLPSRRR